MSRTDVLRLMRRFLVLAVLVIGLALASSGLGRTNATAAVCCSQCPENFDNCLLTCNDDPACIQACNTAWERCNRFCDSLC